MSTESRPPQPLLPTTLTTKGGRAERYRLLLLPRLLPPFPHPMVWT